MDEKQHQSARSLRKARIRLRERAMWELLAMSTGALEINELSQLGLLALSLVCDSGEMFLPSTQSCREAARLLRGQCEDLGIPSERYGQDGWQALGLDQ
jgi:hypothetical protein